MRIFGGRGWVYATVPGLVAALLTALLLTALSGCVLRPQDHPQAVPPGQSTAAAESTSSAAPTGQPEVTVFLVRGDRLSAVRRARGPSTDRLTTSLQALVRPLDDAERTDRLSTALPVGGPDLRWTGVGSGVVIGLPAGFEQLDTRAQVMAIGQLVFTITENSAADSLSFTRAGAHVDVPDGAGRLLSRAVTRQDYEQIAPR